MLSTSLLLLFVAINQPPFSSTKNSVKATLSRIAPEQVRLHNEYSQFQDWLADTAVPALAQHAAQLMLPHVPNYTLVFVNVT